MKKQILALALGILLGSSIFLGATAVAGENIKLIVNGAVVQCDVPPQIINGRVMVPVRFVADALGAEVEWNSATQSVIINSGQTSSGNSAVEQRYPENTSGGNDAVQTGPQEFTVIYDDFLQPLSGNWDLSTAQGSWMVTPKKGATASRRNQESFLCLNTQKYIIPENYTIEAEIIHTGHGDVAETGIFVQAPKELLKDKEWKAAPPIVYIGDYINRPSLNVKTSMQTTRNGSYVNLRYVDGEYFSLEGSAVDKVYLVKIAVNGTSVDVYLDNNYLTSATLDKTGQYVGMFSNSPTSFIKSFRITNNDN